LSKPALRNAVEEDKFGENLLSDKHTFTGGGATEVKM
jgi:hypothetical protein